MAGGEVLRRAVCLLVLFSFVFFPSQALGFAFQDPTGLYSTVIPDQWVFQAHLSSDSLVVFYGAGEQSLLYFEQLDLVEDQDALAFGQRSLELFAQEGGLSAYQLEEPLSALDLAGVEAASCLYSYESEGKIRLWEYRIFVVLPGERGFSLALGDAEETFFENRAVLEQVLENWRWLF
ncbi:MAG: hypothetical protein GX335_10770 [Firmicutes bacterium]|nr:hypothetical protein [Bacillota bacterium]